MWTASVFMDSTQKVFFMVLFSTTKWNVFVRKRVTDRQGGITCGAIDEPRKSSKAIEERVIINFRDKNVVIACFRDKNVYR